MIMSNHAEIKLHLMFNHFRDSILKNNSHYSENDIEELFLNSIQEKIVIPELTGGN